MDISSMARQHLKGAQRNKSMIERMLKKEDVILKIRYVCIDCETEFESFEKCQEHRKKQECN